MNIYPMEIEWIRSIQNFLRSSFMDLFFLGWNLVDTISFSLILITFVWYLVDRKIGIRIFYILILSAIINGLLKKAFSLPRPCHVDPSVGLFCPTSFGFPSGAAQTAALLTGILFIECRKPLYRILGIAFALLLCFSRIYLGVHYFTDILGGLIVGGILILVYWKVIPRMERMWKIAIFLFLAMIWAVGYFSSLLFWISLGVGMGLILSEKNEHRSQRLRVRILQTLSVLLGLGFIYWGFIVFPREEFLFAFAAGLWLSFFGAGGFKKFI